MDGVDFSDFKSSQTWLSSQSTETCCALSARAALRVCSNMMGEEPSKRDRVVLDGLRAILTALCRARHDQTDIEWKSIGKHFPTRNLESFVGGTKLTSGENPFRENGTARFSGAMDSPPSASWNAQGSALAAAHCVFSDFHSEAAAFAIASSRVASTQAQNVSESSSLAKYRARSTSSPPDIHPFVASAQATAWDAGQDIETLYRSPVWGSFHKVQPAIDNNHTGFLSFLSSNPAWKFWAKLYSGMWNGTFDEWDLAFEVIQIEEVDWKKGYEHIGKVIAGLEVPFALKEQIRDLKAEIAKIKGDPPPMGHNLPPELIDEANPPQTLAMIWAAVDELGVELEGKEPDQTRLAILQKRFAGLASRAGQFVKDVGYDHAKEVTTGVVSAVVVANWGTVQSILSDISTKLMEWLAYLIWLVS